jgi:hypothetical protein
MNTKVITTFAFGPMADLLDVSLPTFAAYARLHGYDLYVPSERRFAAISRPPSWWKVPLIISLLEQGYRDVLWLDADVVIHRHDRDIIADAPDRPLAMTVQHTADGAVPSCGVWLVAVEALKFLKGLWQHNSFRRSPGWWEQAAVIHGLGANPDATPVAVPPGPMWGELPYVYNPHRHDDRGIPPAPRFFHATQFADRKAAMQQYARTA